MQNIKEAGFDDSEDAMNAANDENDADRFAASQLPCRVCLKINRLMRRSNPSGYFQPREFDPYIKLNENNRCKAHCCDTKKLEEVIQVISECPPGFGVEDYDDTRVQELDRSMGTLYDRLPAIK